MHSRTTPKTHTNVICSVLRRCWFFVCSLVAIFVTLSAQRHHVGFHFQAVFGALGLFKNSWKCRTIVIFRGLTPFRKSHLAGLESECVLRLRFYRNFRFWMGLGSLIWTLLGPIVVIKWMLKNRAASRNGKNGTGGVSPLKQDKQARHLRHLRQPDNASNTPCVPIGTVADRS